MKYIKIEDICEMLSISRRTLERMRAKKNPPKSTLPVESPYKLKSSMEIETEKFLNNLRNRSFPEPDLFIGKSPRWEQDSLIKWLKEYGKNLSS